jgi:hypothetical protein
MKNFACLILIGLLVNITMANLNENDTIDRFKRGSLDFKVRRQTVSDTKKNFIVAQIKNLYNGVSDKHRNGKLAKTLSNALTNQFGGRWMALGCEKDEFCSFTWGTLPVLEQLGGYYGETFWEVYRV